MVYSSSTASLAVLETLVHLNPFVLFKYKIFQIRFDSKIVETIDPTTLPDSWRIEPPPQSTKELGDAWTSDLRSAVLAVPSAIVPAELNYLLNPAHPDFSKIGVSPPADFGLDPRLLAKLP